VLLTGQGRNGTPNLLLLLLLLLLSQALQLSLHRIWEGTDVDANAQGSGVPRL